jgi:hypothetical protein
MQIEQRAAVETAQFKALIQNTQRAKQLRISVMRHASICEK